MLCIMACGKIIIGLYDFLLMLGCLFSWPMHNDDNESNIFADILDESNAAKYSCTHVIKYFFGYQNVSATN